MKLETHLTFNGNCRDAFEFYLAVFGGSLELLSYGDSPMANKVPPDWHNRIVHSSLNMGESVLAGADVAPETFKKPQGFYLILQPDELIEAERLFSALSTQGEIQMQLQETFWSSGFGSLIDRFGIPWEINCTQQKEQL